jgi:hypothetical protein
VSGEVSWFSRFFGKFAEVIAVGLATAVSGYLVAHLGGLSSSPTPTAVQTAPTAGGVSGKPLAEPTPPVSAEAKEQRPASPAPAQRTVNATKMVSPPKHMKTDTSATESKPRDEKSVEAQVRAALANIDANPPEPPAVPPNQDNVGPGPAALGAPPKPADGPFAVGPPPVVPRTADQPRPLQQAPVTAVEVLPAPWPSRPVEENHGSSGPEKIIPDLPYPPPEPPGEVPRPPMPVGR